MSTSKIVNPNAIASGDSLHSLNLSKIEGHRYKWVGSNGAVYARGAISSVEKFEGNLVVFFVAGQDEHAFGFSAHCCGWEELIDGSLVLTPSHHEAGVYILAPPE